MASAEITARVLITSVGATKTVRLDPNLTVREAMLVVAEKANLTGLDRTEVCKRFALYLIRHPRGVYLDDLSRTVKSYNFPIQPELELRPAPDPIFVISIDGTRELFKVNFDSPCSQILVDVCDGFGLKRPMEFELLSPGRPGGEVLSIMHSLKSQLIDPNGTLKLRRKPRSLWKKMPSARASIMRSGSRKLSAAGQDGPPGDKDKAMKPSKPKKDPVARQQAHAARGGAGHRGRPGGAQRGAFRPGNRASIPMGGTTVFATPLGLALRANKRQSNIPNFLEDAITHIRNTSLDVEGIFRRSGSLVEVQKLRRRYNNGEQVNLNEIRDPHVVCGVLKLFLRELPEPLLTFELYSQFLELPVGQSSGDTPLADDELSQQIAALLLKLPKPNLWLLRAICTFLLEVAQHSDRNRMTFTNLAVVFGPNLLRNADEDVMLIAQHTPIVNNIACYLMAHSDSIFVLVDAERPSRPAHSPSPGSSPALNAKRSSAASAAALGAPPGLPPGLVGSAGSNIPNRPPPTAPLNQAESGDGNAAGEESSYPRPPSHVVRQPPSSAMRLAEQAMARRAARRSTLDKAKSEARELAQQQQQADGSGDEASAAAGWQSGAAPTPATQDQPAADGESSLSAAEADSDADRPYYLRAAFSYEAENDEELTLYEGALVEVVLRDETGWWEGRIGKQAGLFPVTYCEEIPAAELDELLAEQSGSGGRYGGGDAGSYGESSSYDGYGEGEGEGGYDEYGEGEGEGGYDEYGEGEGEGGYDEYGEGEGEEGEGEGEGEGEDEGGYGGAGHHHHSSQQHLRAKQESPQQGRVSSNAAGSSALDSKVRSLQQQVEALQDELGAVRQQLQQEQDARRLMESRLLQELQALKLAFDESTSG